MGDTMKQALKKAGIPFTDTPQPQPQPQKQPRAYYDDRGRAPAPGGTAGALSLGENYVDEAEQVMTNFFATTQSKNFTTSKIRNILSMVSELYNELSLMSEETLSAEMIQRIQYLRVRLVYESGREESVKAFINAAKLVEYIKGVGKSRHAFIRYAHYMEALVAYHRYFGGKDK